MSDKVCIRCKEEWPSDDEFYRLPNSHVCRACESDRRAELKKDRSLSALDPKKRANTLFRRRYHAEIREMRLQQMRDWRARNREKTRADARAYYYAVRKPNKEALNAASR